MTRASTHPAIHHISRKTRMEQGIFFTSPHLVEEIAGEMDMTVVRSVIDSAAGSGNFLIPLAEKYPHIQFYGVEKNAQVFEAAQRRAEGLSNVHLFLGDILLDSFPIPPCDLYLGNPPFINYSDLPDDYREQIRPVSEKHLALPRDFSLILGNSRADISQLIFQLTVDNYLGETAQIGVLLPESLLQGGASRWGFQQCRGFSINQIVETPESNAFEATERRGFYVIARKGEETRYPLNYRDSEGKEKRIFNLQGQWQIHDRAPRCYPSHWLGNYKARQGINTLGANGIFFFREKPDLEEELIHPLLRSGDLEEWYHKPSCFCLIPYDRNGNIITPEVLEKGFPKTWTYLNKHREKLSNRKSRFVKKHWYGLFGVGDYTFYKYKVLWRALGAKEMYADVVPHAMPNQAMFCFFATNNLDEAYYLAGWLNSSTVKREIKTLCKSGSKSFAQPGVMANLPIPPYSAQNPFTLQISKATQRLYGHQSA